MISCSAIICWVKSMTASPLIIFVIHSVTSVWLVMAYLQNRKLLLLHWGNWCSNIKKALSHSVTCVVTWYLQRHLGLIDDVNASLLATVFFLWKLTNEKSCQTQDRNQLMLAVLSLHLLAEFWPLRDVSMKKKKGSLCGCMNVRRTGEENSSCPPMHAHIHTHTFRRLTAMDLNSLCGGLFKWALI